MAKAAAGGGGPDLLLIAAVGAMAFLALRSRAAVAGVPAQTAAQLRPDYTAQRNLAYAQMGVGLLGTVAGWLGSGSPDGVIGGSPVSGIFGSTSVDATEYRNLNGWLGQLGIDATDGWNVPEFDRYNGAYTYGSLMESPNLADWMRMGA
ncbi:hypothetical protein [Cupriavidus oxalaticus]|uniref:hypothetical protein n=1 Tax=Cupriavidus oxalaticus TaxID=96344 RepID=UPI00403382D9